ncbi:hypothetical protein YC2023_082511 [Brassica napus]
MSFKRVSRIAIEEMKIGMENLMCSIPIYRRTSKAISTPIKSESEKIPKSNITPQRKLSSSSHIQSNRRTTKNRRYFHRNAQITIVFAGFWATMKRKEREEERLCRS